MRAASEIDTLGAHKRVVQPCLPCSLCFVGYTMLEREHDYGQTACVGANQHIPKDHLLPQATVLMYLELTPIARFTILIVLSILIALFLLSNPIHSFTIYCSIP